MKKVIKFSTSTCIPCKTLQPVWDNLVKDFSNQNFQFLEIECDTEEAEELCNLVERLKVTRVPVIMIIDSNEKVIAQESGVDLSGRKYRKMLIDNA